MSDWISVEDKLPNESVKRYLCYTSSGAVRIGYFYKGKWRLDSYAATFEELGYTLTHWQPLPEPPQ